MSQELSGMLVDRGDCSMLTMLDFICSLHRNHQDGKEGGQMTLQKRKRKGEWTSIVCNLLVNNFLIKCSQSNHGI